MERKKMIITVIAAVLMVTLIGTVSYAYFNSNITSKNQEVKLETGTMELSFSDNDASITGNLNFGESIVKKFKIENTGSLEASLKMLWKDLVNTYTNGSLTYVLAYSETEDGEYTALYEKANVPVSSNETTKTLAAKVTVPAGKTYFYKLTVTLEYLDNVDQTDDFDAVFHTKFTVDQPDVTSGGNTGGDVPVPIVKGWLQDAVTHVVNGESPESVNVDTPNFESAAISYEGLYSMPDNYGTSYYYRGASNNNYVSFAGYMWRIIRINGDGSVRMIYDGTKAYENGEVNNDRVLTSQLFQTKIYGNSGVGYMFSADSTPAGVQTNSESSNIKTLLENWYNTKIVNEGYDEYVADAIFCNDRTMTSGTGGSDINTTYSTYNRLFTTKEPTFICPESTLISINNNWFTKDATDENLGNGALMQPIGLITADEAVAAGAPLSTTITANTNFYLYKGIPYWTMSPSRFYNNSPYVYGISSNGKVIETEITSTAKYGLAPVINIKAEYAKNFTGDGSTTAPYSIALN